METEKFYKVAGVAVTLLLIGIGIHIGLKNKDRDGFWWGVLALLLIGSSVRLGGYEMRKV